MTFKLIQIRPKIYHADFDNEYDLSMTFLRYQEFYESDNPQFRDKPFKLLDFMEWYAKTRGNGVFTYTRDWGGYNLPSDVIGKIVYGAGMIPDPNDYDTTMRNIYDIIGAGSYLIGTCGNDALDHELAHGFFYTNSSYRREMKALVKELNADTRDDMFSYLTDLGYAKKVLIDETQAYLATGFSLPGKKRIGKPFVETLKCYMESE